MEREILGARWFTLPPGFIGVVAAITSSHAPELGEWRAYIGPVLGINLEGDQQLIANQGAKLFPEEAQAFFPHLDIRKYKELPPEEAEALHRNRREFSMIEKTGGLTIPVVKINQPCEECQAPGENLQWNVAAFNMRGVLCQTCFDKIVDQINSALAATKGQENGL